MPVMGVGIVKPDAELALYLLERGDLITVTAKSNALSGGRFHGQMIPPPIVKSINRLPQAPGRVICCFP